MGLGSISITVSTEDLIVVAMLVVEVEGIDDVAVVFVFHAGGNCIKIGFPGKLILSKRKGLWEVLFS